MSLEENDYRDPFDDDLVDDGYDDDVDDYEDATSDDVDFVVALYREDGQPVATALSYTFANDLDDLIDQLRRLPGDAGALGVVSIASELFILVRVRGRNVQVLLNDDICAYDWPIARDVVDYLGADMPDEDGEGNVIGDLSILSDLGIRDFDMEQIATDLDDSDQLVRRIAHSINFGRVFDRAIRRG